MMKMTRRPALPNMRDCFWQSRRCVHDSDLKTDTPSKGRTLVNVRELVAPGFRAGAFLSEAAGLSLQGGTGPCSKVFLKPPPTQAYENQAYHHDTD